jgi:hypothetical protein
MTLLALLAAIGTILFFGAGIAAILLARNRSLNLFECACLAWPLGVASVSMALWILGSIASGAVLQALVTALAVLAGVAGWRIVLRSGARLTIPKPETWIEYLLLAIVLTQVATIFYACGKHTLGWDGLLVWELKARIAFLTKGFLPASYFADQGRAFSHPDYPLAIPFTQLWLYLWMGEANQFWAKIIFPVFYAAGVGLLGLLGSRLTGRRWIGYGLAASLYFVPQVSVTTGSVLVGYADFPLGVFYLGTVGYLLCCLTRTPGASFSIFATFLAFLPWIKKEGAILWLVAALAGAVVVVIRHKPRLALFALLPGLGVILIWRAFLRVVHATPTLDVLPLTIETVRSNLGRLPSIYHVVLIEASTVSHWGIFWLVAAAALSYLVWRWRELPCSLLLWTILVPLCLYSFTYVFSAWHVYLDHVSSSISRLMMQVVPAAWLAIGIVVSEWTSKGSRSGPLFGDAASPVATTD